MTAFKAIFCCLSSIVITAQAFFPNRCTLTGDPHISTIDGNYYDQHEPGEYFPARACNWNWRLQAYLDDPFQQGWTVFRDLELAFGRLRPIAIPSERVLRANRYNRRVTYQLRTLNGLVNIERGPGGEVLVIINNDNYDLSPIEVWTSFGLEFHIYVDPWPMLFIWVEKRWMNNLCGLCGPFDGDPSNDLDNADNSEVPMLRGRRNVEEGALPRKRRAVETCSAEVLAAAQAYCEYELHMDVGNCNDAQVSMFEEFCIFDYCVNGTETASYSITAFHQYCSPPKRATCTMCGFREIQTFDNKKFKYLGSECEYEFAKDCSGNDVWSVNIILSEQKLGAQKELLLARVKITYNGNTAIYIRGQQIVKVNDVEVTGDYTSPGSDFVIFFLGDGVQFMAADLRISYNFKQLLEVEVREQYFGQTCGLCGNFNDDESDDLTAGGNYQVKSGCDAGGEAFQCSTTAEYNEAVEICQEALQAVACSEVDINDRLDACANEYCDGKGKYLCQHILEYMDKCFLESNDATILNFEPESCKRCLPGRRFGAGLSRPISPGCDGLGGRCLNPRCERCKGGNYVADVCHSRKFECCVKD